MSKLELLFRPEDQAEAIRLLVEECGHNLPFCADGTPQSLERIRFAALKLSAGELPMLREAVKLGQADWRDLLMSAGFGDPEAHKKWAPNGKLN